MTFAQLQNLFKSKYPDGDIWQTTATNKSKYSICIAYKPQGKVYNYIVSNYIIISQHIVLKTICIKHS